MKPVTICLQFQHFSCSVYLSEAEFCVSLGATHKEQKANKPVHPPPPFSSLQQSVLNYTIYPHFVGETLGLLCQKFSESFFLLTSSVLRISSAFKSFSGILGSAPKHCTHFGKKNQQKTIIVNCSSSEVSR